MTKWKWLVAVLTVTAGVVICNNSLDNDSWYVLAEGREIVENGIYYEDQLSMHEGLEVTVQNYGFAAIFYLIYSVFGPVGVYVGMLLINLLLVYLIYKICMLISNKNVNLSLILAVLTDLLLSRWFVVTRAQMVSYCIIMLVIYLLELYIKNKNTKYLWWIPVLSLLQINLHASLWPMIPIVLGVYIIDSFKCKKLHLDGYKTKPLVITLVATVLVGFLNPYGVKMLMFIPTSYGVPEAMDYINELRPFTPFSNNFNILLYVVIVMVILIYIFGKRQNLKMRWLILTFGFLALGLNTYKGMSHLILVLLFPLAAVYRDIKIKDKYKKWVWVGGFWAGILAASIIVGIAIVSIPEMLDGPNKELIAAVDVIDTDIGNDVNKDDLKVYVGYDQGGFLEYRGYKAYMDPRMEVFIKSNNKKEELFQEYYDLQKGKGKEQEFLDKYDFDYLMIIKGEKLYDFEMNDDYEMIYNVEVEETDAHDDYGIKVYKKLKNFNYL